MGDRLDPESEALIRKLHRELNGLTRSTRPQFNGSLERRPPSRPKADAQRTEATHTGSRRKAHLDGSGSEASSSGSEEKADKPGKKQKKADHNIEPHKASKQASPSSPARPASTGLEQQRKHVDMPRKPPSDKVQELVKSEQGQGAEIGTGAAAPTGSTKLRPAKSEQEAPSSSQPAAFKTALEAAAAASSILVREKVKAAASAGQASTGQRMVKCFHAGVRWGITLAPDALKTRADLATALNDAFAGEILSCGRGDILNIVFLDSEGHVTEFPSLRTCGARDSSSKWKVSVERALKIYVRRG